jgi:ubiquinone/menaquinone biosynthesis C-methylase UbiE
MRRDAANAWNRLRYTVYAPVYDRIAGFGAQRRRSVELLAPVPGERILIAGAGTGGDLPYLPDGVRVTAIDLTPAMVRRTRGRAAALGVEVDAHVMDAHALELPSGTFDAVILHLILAVAADPAEVLQEVGRVLVPNGRAVVFDKFAADAGPLSLRRRLANLVTAPLATDVTRRLGPLVQDSGLELVHREDAGFGGFFQIALLRRGAPARA